MSNSESKSGQKDERLLIQHAGLRRLGKYELIARIGEGGMAEVYLARQRGPMDFEKVVVVKTIHPHLGRKKKFIDMLLDEARIAARLKHPCVVDIYDLGVEGDTYFIAMEHLAGETLLSVLRACVKKRQLDVPCTARIIADIADGLQSAHDLKDNASRPLELVHRDITPGNIVVLYTGQVKILDFGIAKARGRLADETDADHFKGKLGYISPEQVRGQKIDRRSDIFSLGVVMWEALALRRLFRKNTPAAAADAILKEPIPPPSKYRSSVPPKLDNICMRALARDPDERYGNAAEMQEDIERFLAAGSFRPHKAAIRKYMHETFADRIEEREQLLNRVVVATSEFLVSSMPRHSTGDIDNSGDEYAVMEMSSGSSPGMQLPKARSAPLPKPGEDSTPAGAGERLAGTSTGGTAVPQGQPAPWLAGRSKGFWAGITGAAMLLLVTIIVVAGSGGGSDSNAVAGKRASTSDKETGSEAGNAAAGNAAAGKTSDDQRAVAATQTAEQEGSPGADSKPDGENGEPGSDDGAAAGNQDTSAQESGQGGPDEQGKSADGNDSSATAENGPSAEDAQKKRRPRRSDPKALYNEGIKLYVAGKLSPAKDKFRAAVKAKSSYAAAYRGLGMVYQRQGKKKQAADAYRKYLRLAPNARDKSSIEKRLAALGG